jgi:hypothetical protein
VTFKETTCRVLQLVPPTHGVSDSVYRRQAAADSSTPFSSALFMDDFVIVSASVRRGSWQLGCVKSIS